ncbi:MAG TPA: chorismate mutase [Patescibacteria group bacterium]
MPTIEELRNQIDQIDQKLLEVIKERIAVMRQIGEMKKSQNIEIRDFEREDTKIAMLKQQAAELNIPENIIMAVWNVFFENSLEIEK